MKNKKIHIVTLILAVILTTGMNSSAQRGPWMGRDYSCCLNISGLSEKQKTEIANLVQQHRKEMDEMRRAWQESGSNAGREAHLAAVDKKVSEHRAAVRNLLNPEQKEVFDSLQTQGRRYWSAYGGGKAGRKAFNQGNCYRSGRHGNRWM